MPQKSVVHVAQLPVQGSTQGETLVKSSTKMLLTTCSTKGFQRCQSTMISRSWLVPICIHRTGRFGRQGGHHVFHIGGQDAGTGPTCCSLEVLTGLPKLKGRQEAQR